MIDKKVLGEVLGEVLRMRVTEVYDEQCSFPDCGKEVIAYTTEENEGRLETINENHFAHMCKEWAYNRGYIVSSRHDNVPTLWTAYVYLSPRLTHQEVECTEADAIFQLTFYVMKNCPIKFNPIKDQMLELDFSRMTAEAGKSIGVLMEEKFKVPLDKYIVINDTTVIVGTRNMKKYSIPYGEADNIRVDSQSN